MAQGSQKPNSGKDWNKAGAGMVWGGGWKMEVDRPVVKGGGLSTLNEEPYSNRRDLGAASVQGWTLGPPVEAERLP